MTGHALRLTVFIGDDHRWNRKPLYHEIVTRARDAGLAGATVLHGHEGFGASSLVHTDRLLDIADSLPIVIVIVDTEDRVRGFLPQLDEVIGEGLVVLDKVEILRHNGQQTS